MNEDSEATTCEYCGAELKLLGASETPGINVRPPGQPIAGALPKTPPAHPQVPGVPPKAPPAPPRVPSQPFGRKQEEGE